MSFIKSTINAVRIIGAESIDDLYTWVNAGYAVHNDMFSHIGRAMYTG